MVVLRKEDPSMDVLGQDSGVLGVGLIADRETSKLFISSRSQKRERTESEQKTPVEF